MFCVTRVWTIAEKVRLDDDASELGTSIVPICLVDSSRERNTIPQKEETLGEVGKGAKNRQAIGEVETRWEIV